MPSEDSEHDAELYVLDIGETEYATGGKSFDWRWVDGRDENQMRGRETLVYETVLEDALDNLDPDDYADRDVVARVWMTDDKQLDRVEWHD